MPGVTTAYQTGVHGSRPANGAGCILYSCTTHNKVYRDDGSTWIDFLVLPAAGLTDPMTTRGDIIVRNSSNATARLAVGAANRVFTSDGTDPSWAQVTPAMLDVSVDNTTANATSGHHGLLPKLSGSSSDALKGDGTWGAAGGGGGGILPWRADIDPFNFQSQTNWSTIVAVNASASNKLQYIESSGAQNAELNYEGVALSAGTWDLFVIAFKGPSSGIITASLDGGSVGTMDLYTGAGTPEQRLSITGITVATDDVYQLKLKMATKNGSSSSYYGDIAKVGMARTA